MNPARRSVALSSLLRTIGHCFCVLTAVLSLLVCGLSQPATTTPDEKGKPAVAAQTKKSRSSARRKTPVKKGKKGKARRAAEPPPVIGPPVADRIEVIEPDTTPAHGRTRSATRSQSRPASDPDAPDAEPNVSTRRLEVAIEPKRATEIQQALIERGFLIGPPTGLYDDATIDAMRRFQARERIDVTGYPTAHALKRLGLTNW
jgi:cytoskeletal protein RodZ